MPTTSNYPRFGLVVGKKIAPLAVQRNYMKRVLRNLFYQHRYLLGGIDILVRVHKPFTHANYKEVRSEYVALLQRLVNRLKQPGGLV